jgi:MOSC domain-containing protein YiiM
VAKHAVDVGRLSPNWGVVGDGHAGEWHRQVSLLTRESIAGAMGPDYEPTPGEFAENILTEGITLHTLPLGTRLRVGKALLEITQIGKPHHEHPSVFELKGGGLMPREGVFARVLTGGDVQPGDAVQVIAGHPGGGKSST